ncbi:hypothetical protein C8R44DRAFT_850168 [Mycena epipterygia]|nr:hypothetical protein C8R44DRAFT_850168 [Mycena epipterygia]
MWASAGGSAAAGTASPAAGRQDTATHTPARTGCCTVRECSIGPVWRGHTAHNGGLRREVAHRGEEVFDGHKHTMAVLCPYHCLYPWGRHHPSLSRRRSLSPSARPCGYSTDRSSRASTIRDAGARLLKAPIPRVSLLESSEAYGAPPSREAGALATGEDNGEVASCSSDHSSVESQRTVREKVEARQRRMEADEDGEKSL